jgi:hypothetical protein
MSVDICWFSFQYSLVLQGVFLIPTGTMKIRAFSVTACFLTLGSVWPLLNLIGIKSYEIQDTWDLLLLD